MCFLIQVKGGEANTPGWEPGGCGAPGTEDENGDEKPRQSLCLALLGLFSSTRNRTAWGPEPSLWQEGRLLAVHQAEAARPQAPSPWAGETSAAHEEGPWGPQAPPYPTPSPLPVLAGGRRKMAPVTWAQGGAGRGHMPRVLLGASAHPPGARAWAVRAPRALCPCRHPCAALFTSF